MELLDGRGDDGVEGRLGFAIAPEEQGIIGPPGPVLANLAEAFNSCVKVINNGMQNPTAF